MIVYAESSAVATWLLSEPTGPSVRACLDEAAQVVSSSLTSVECTRALIRAQLMGRLTVTQSLAARQLLEQAVAAWSVQSLNANVLTRASAPMPGDPVRTLDALHIATAQILRDALGPIAMLSLDLRVRTCAGALGFAVLP